MINEVPKHMRLIYRWFLIRKWTVDDAMEYFENMDSWPGQDFFAPHREALSLLKEYKND